MYSHLTFPEYVLTILESSMLNFQPNYMFRFRSYKNFDTHFKDFESFLEFYSSMLYQAKERATGPVHFMINKSLPTFMEGAEMYCLYDRKYVHPIMQVEVLIEGDKVTLGVPPF